MKLRMKKFIAAGIAALMLFAFAACGVKLDISIDIAEDGTVTYGTVTAYDEEFIDMMIQYGDDIELESLDGEAGSDDQDSGNSVDSSDPDGDVQKEYTDEDRWAYIEKQVFEGIKDKDYERYETTDAKGIHWMGFTIKKPAKNIDDISSATQPSERVNIYGPSDAEWEGALFYKSGKNYVSNMMVDVSEDEDFSSIKENNEGMDISMLVVVTLPTKVISSNASEVSEDGKTLTWNLMEMEDPNIDFEFDLHPFPTTIVLLAVLGVVVLLLIAAVVFLIVSMTKKSKKYDDNLAALAGDTPAEGTLVRPEIQDSAEGTGDPASVDEVSDSDVSPVTDDTMSESAIETAEELKAEALEAAKEAEEEAREAAEGSGTDIEETEDPVDAEETEDPSGEGDTE